MKNLFAASTGLGIALLMPIAEATPKTIEACTQDGKTAILTLEAEGVLFDRSTESIARDAFIKTAKQLTSDVLGKPDGVTLFLNNMIEMNLAIRAANAGKTPDLAGQKLVLMGVTIDRPTCNP